MSLAAPLLQVHKFALKRAAQPAINECHSHLRPEAADAGDGGHNDDLGGRWVERRGSASMAALPAAITAAQSQCRSMAYGQRDCSAHLTATGTLQVWVHGPAAVVAAGRMGMGIKPAAAQPPARQLRSPQRSTVGPAGPATALPCNALQCTAAAHSHAAGACSHARHVGLHHFVEHVAGHLVRRLQLAQDTCARCGVIQPGVVVTKTLLALRGIAARRTYLALAISTPPPVVPLPPPTHPRWPPGC